MIFITFQNVFSATFKKKTCKKNIATLNSRVVTLKKYDLLSKTLEKYENKLLKLDGKIF